MFVKVISFFFLLAAACSRASAPSEKDSRKPLVLVSIAPYVFLAKAVGGDEIEVQTITPPQSNPHAFEPTSRQVSEIAKGKIWLRIGEPFEEKILPLLPDLAVYDLRDGIALQPHEDGHFCAHCSSDHLDRHIWMSPKLMSHQAETIAAILSDRFPEHAGKFKKNLADCLAELEVLDLEIRSLLAPKTFIVSHSAFGYFCRDYGLEQLSVEQEGKEPRPRHLEAMIEKAKTAHAEIALALPQHNNKGAQLIAEHLNVPIRMIDPYSADYFIMMRKLAHLIANPHYEQP